MNSYWVSPFGVFTACYDDGGENGQGQEGVEGQGQGGQGAGSGQGGQGAGSGQGGQGAGSGQGGQGAGSGKDNTFTQEDLNRILAEDRRKHQEKYSTLEQSYQELLENQNLSKDERSRLEGQLEDLRKQYRTKEQQLEYEKKQAEQQYATQIEELSEKAKTWETRYTESTINQALQSAAVQHDAFNPTQIVTQLKSQTRLVEKLDHNNQPTGQLVPMVDMDVTNEDSGAMEQLQMTPSEAVEYMKKNPEQWGNFFRNNIRDGIGSSSGTGDAFTGNGVVNHEKLNDDQYFKLRRENPAALGLKPRR